MFNNIGGKIKGLAKFICWLGIVLSVLSGVVIMIGAEDYTGSLVGGVVAALLVIVVGCLASWIGSFFTYGFGQLIENTDKMVQNQK